jgi:hypothetical protein
MQAKVITLKFDPLTETIQLTRRGPRSNRVIGSDSLGKNFIERTRLSLKQHLYPFQEKKHRRFGAVAPESVFGFGDLGPARFG